MRHRLLNRIAVTAGTLGVAATVSWAGGAVPAFAATVLYAAPGGTGDCSAASPCSVDYAVNVDAVAGDTVMLAGGTYSGTELQPPGSITLTAEAGATPVLSGGASGPILRADTGSATVTGVTFTDVGTVYPAVQCGFGALDLEQSAITTTGQTGVLTAHGVGGICGSVTLNNSEVTANTAVGSNAFGIDDQVRAPITLTASSVTVNSTVGAPPVTGPPAVAAIPGQTAYGIYDTAGGAVRLTNSTIDAESTGKALASPYDDAYGVYVGNVDVPLTVTGSTITANVHGAGATGDAYGIDADNGSPVSVTSSTITVGANGGGPDEQAWGLEADHTAGSLVVASDEFQLTGSNSAGGDVEGIQANSGTSALTVTGSQFAESSVAKPGFNGSIDGIVSASSVANGLSVASSSFTMSSPAGRPGYVGGSLTGIETSDPSATVSTSTFSGTAGAYESTVEGINANNANGLTVDDSTLSLTASSTDTSFAPDDLNSSAQDIDAVGPVTLNGDTVSVVAHQSGEPIGGTTYNYGVGAVSEQGPLTVNDSTVSASADLTGAAGPILPAVAVGILSAGATTVNDSTISTAGTATGLDSDASYGGASTTTLRVENSTVTGTGDHTVGIATDALRALLHAATGAPAPAGTQANVGVEQSTIALNGVGVAEYGGSAASQTVRLDTDIVGGNSVDCDVTTFGLIDLGGNIASDSSCGFGNSSSVNHSTTLASTLAPLANNGGPTETIGLLSTSPAIGLVTGYQTLFNGNLACSVADQRGVNRPGFTTLHAPCDAGAVNLTVAAGAGGAGGGGAGAGGGAVSTETMSLSASPATSVFGQPVAFTAVLSPTPNCGTVLWSVDGEAQGTGVPATGGTLALGSLSNLGVGSHTVLASFAGCGAFGIAAASDIQVVGKAATTASVTAGTSALTATIAPVAPGAGTPTGTVSFAVDGAPVGTATLGSNGQASVADTLTNVPHVVSVSYAGDGNFTGSSASTPTSGAVLKNPAITAAVTSAKPESPTFWYRSPVTVTFTCTAGSAPLDAAGCPAPVTLSTSGVAQSVTRTVTATDGGTSSVAVSPINIDLSAPAALTVHGVVRGGTYSYAQRHKHLTCSATDLLSGIARCVVTTHTTTTKKFKVVHYKLTATNNAGTSATKTGSYRYHRKHS